jgi:hypothetical protein
MSRDDDIAKDAYTGNGFDRDQAATTNLLLRKSVVETRDLKDVSANLVIVQRSTTKAIQKLTTIITSLDQKNGVLQIRVYVLSVITGILALAQLLVAIFH